MIEDSDTITIRLGVKDYATGERAEPTAVDQRVDGNLAQGAFTLEPRLARGRRAGSRPNCSAQVQTFSEMTPIKLKSLSRPPNKVGNVTKSE